jgi:hypothetical protein
VGRRLELCKEQGYRIVVRLLGDIRIERKNIRFYFPVMTCLLLSVVLSFVFWVIRLFRG